MNRPVILIIGTRPEAIKMLPVYFALQRMHIPTLICATNQHSELLDEGFSLFEVTPDIRLDIMQPGQDLFHITTVILEKAKALFNRIQPSLVVVQGDTTSSMAAALAAFYLKIPVAHVEAGLRTHDMQNPFPEEFNRSSIALVADYHFAPTQLAQSHLLSAGIVPEKIFFTGNTVVDAFRIIRHQIEQHEIVIDENIVDIVHQCKTKSQQLVLLTVHRRESFNGGIVRILQSIKTFAQENPDIFFFYPVHPNPYVAQAIETVGLDQISNIYRCKAVTYKHLLYILLHANWVITDSGGIQEEATSLSKYTLVVREKTERMEGILAGLAELVGTDEHKITQAMKQQKNRPRAHMPTPTAIYGNGFAADAIAAIIKKTYGAHQL